MPESVVFLVDRLRTEGDKTKQYFEALADVSWNQVVYTENSEWTVRDIFAHFISSERGFIALFRSILDGGPGVAADFEIDSFNAKQHEAMREATPGELVDLYVEIRGEMISLASSMSEQDLDKTGRHPFLGETPLREMIKMVYRHNQIHMRDIRRLLP